jgi:uncharacterized membrane protein HdeD (DUF308 family)
MKNILTNWKLGALEGILFMVLGSLAIIYPIISTLSVAIFLGTLLVVAGLAIFVCSWKEPHQRDWISMIGAFIISVIGFLMIFSPSFGIFTITGLVTTYLAFDGICRLFFTLSLPSHLRSGWLFLSGCLSLLLAMLIWSGWPSVALWFVGFLVGMNLFFSGVALLAFSLAVKKHS